MTYREKLAQEHPECVGNQHGGGCKDCPTDYGYEEGIHCNTVGDDCTACWDREIPNTEPVISDYDRGMIDAWELAKKISDTLTTSKRAEIFGYVVNGITVMDILRDFTPQEALAKLEAYEKEQAEIKVGDVVFNKDTNEHCVITHIEGKFVVYCLYDDGSCGTSNIKECEKTSKHIDIQSVLEQIGSDADELS